jgi:integrase
VIDGLPADFRFHDLRHYFASLLIGSGLDVKVVQHRLRHGPAQTTLDTYGHLWPDSRRVRTSRRAGGSCGLRQDWRTLTQQMSRSEGW